ncbi:hypothetical protein HYQ46_012197 [Verticillium longisporum]|nr:hypothetical protein HYQ46_012197 [Verticillium longisporum]
MNLAVELLNPLVILVRDARVPSVAEVELGRDHIASPRLSSLSRVNLHARLLPRVERPGSVSAVQVDNIADIIHERDVDVQS